MFFWMYVHNTDAEYVRCFSNKISIPPEQNHNYATGCYTEIIEPLQFEQKSNRINNSK